MSIIGGFVGFLAGMLVSLSCGSSIPKAFWRASLAASLSGLLLWWWSKIWINCFITVKKEQAKKKEQETSQKKGPEDKL
jgi:hypothetical protein